MIDVEELIEFLLELFRGPFSVLQLVFDLVGVRGRFIVLVTPFFTLSLTNVCKAREVLPTAYCFEDGHVLVIRVVAMAKCVQNVTKLLFALKVFFVLSLKGFERIMMCEKRFIQRYGMCHWCCKKV